MIVLLAVLLSATLNREVELVNLRRHYEKAVNNQYVANELLKRLEQMPPATPLYVGYTGAVNMILAKFLNNPINKLESFNKGKYMLERAIKESPDDLELRFLRYTVQSNTPIFLGYSNNLKSDKVFLLLHVDDAKDKDLQNRIVLFLLANASLTQTETNILKNIK
jgi:hypothetical protein